MALFSQTSAKAAVLAMLPVMHAGPLPLPGCAHLRSASDLPHQQLIGGDQRERRHAAITRPVAVVLEGNSLREAADHMVREGIGRLPVVTPDGRLAGIITRSDLLAAHGRRLEVA